MFLIIVEDDDLWYQEAEQDFEGLFPNHEVLRFPCEHAFVSSVKLEELKKADLFLMDLIVHFDDPDEEGNVVIPPENYEGRFNAGIRCIRYLRENNILTPVLLYSASPCPDEFKEKDLGAVLYEAKKRNINGWRDSIRQLLKKRAE